MLHSTSYNNITKAIQEGILKNESNLLVCTVCKTSMDISSADSHLQGHKHRKALQNSRIGEALKQSSSVDSADSFTTDLHTAISQGIVTCENIANLVRLTCEVCKKPTTGDVPMTQHLKSEMHAKKMKRNAFNSVASPARVPASSGTQVQYQLVSSTTLAYMQEVLRAVEKGVVLTAPDGSGFLMCSLCNVTCNGDKTMGQHLESAAHMKQARMKELRQSLSPAKEVSVCSVMPSAVQCDSALTTTTVPSSPSTTSGLNSTVPAAASTEEEYELAEAMRKGIVARAGHDESHFECLVCDVPCTGREAMMQHLTGKNHAKKLQKKSFRMSVSPGREASVPVITLGGDTSVPDSPAVPASTSTVQGNEPDENSLVCSVCDITCTGREAMDQHRRGKSHLRKLKLKGLRVSASPGREGSVPVITLSDDSTLEDSSAVPAATSTVQENELNEAMSKGLVIRSGHEESHLKCLVCDVPCTGREAMMQHLTGKNHLKKHQDASGGKLGNTEAVPGPPRNNGGAQREESAREIIKDIRVYGPQESLSDLFD